MYTRSSSTRATGWHALALACLFGLLGTTTRAQQWLPLGPNEGKWPSAGPDYHTSLKMDPAGNLVVAYQDMANAGRTTVMRWNGSTWNIVGTLPCASSPTLADHSGVPCFQRRHVGIWGETALRSPRV